MIGSTSSEFETSAVSMSAEDLRSSLREESPEPPGVDEETLGDQSATPANPSVGPTSSAAFHWLPAVSGEQLVVYLGLSNQDLPSPPDLDGLLKPPQSQKF